MRIDWKKILIKRDIKCYHACVWVGTATGLISLLFRYIILQLTELRTDFFSSELPPILKIFIMAPILWLLFLGINHMIKNYYMVGGNGA